VVRRQPRAEQQRERRCRRQPVSGQPSPRAAAARPEPDARTHPHRARRRDSLALWWDVDASSLAFSPSAMRGATAESRPASDFAGAGSAHRSPPPMSRATLSRSRKRLKSAAGPAGCAGWATSDPSAPAAPMFLKLAGIDGESANAGGAPAREPQFTPAVRSLSVPTSPTTAPSSSSLLSTAHKRASRPGTKWGRRSHIGWRNRRDCCSARGSLRCRSHCSSSSSRRPRCCRGPRWPRSCYRCCRCSCRQRRTPPRRCCGSNS
jgi:hypothetical protein